MNRLTRLLQSAASVLFAFGGTAFAACSPYLGTVVFNEVQIPNGDTTYLELRVNDPYVVAATSNFSSWRIGIFNAASNSPQYTANLGTLFADTTANTCGQSSPWVRLPNSVLNSMIVRGTDTNFVLFDSATNQIIDVLRMGAQSNLYNAGTSYASCSVDSTFTSRYGSAWGGGSSIKDWYRDPDGTGVWTGTVNANNANSICGSNNAGAANLIGLTKLASTSTINTNVNFTYTLTAQNPATASTQTSVVVTDTLPAGISFVSCAFNYTTQTGDACNGTSWTIASLPSNSSKSVTVTVKATTTTGSPFTNTISGSNTVVGNSSSATVTVSNSAPAITTVAATSVSTTGATLNGTVNANSSSTSTTMGFGYSNATGSYVNSCSPTTPSSATGTSPVNFSCTLSGLVCGTTYYFRATGTNSTGTTNGGELNFTTSACPASGLDAVEVNASPATKIYTKLAGTAFSLDVVATNSNGTVNTSYAKTVTPVLVDASTGCSTTALTGVTVSPSNYTYTAGDNGRKTFSFTSTRAAANVKVRMTDNSSTPIAVCSTDAFAIRPSGLTITSTNANADSTGLSATATPVITAGSGNFSLVASSGTAGYDGTPSFVSAQVQAHSGAAATGTLAGTFSAASSSTGQASGSAFTYSEVGYFRLNANGVIDNTFTNIDSASGDCVANSTSNTLTGGKYGCNIGSAQSAYFGRFIPANFVLNTGSAITPACSTGGFIYMGQVFTVAASMQANNGASTPAKTSNYDGSYAKGVVSYAAENADNGTDLSTRLAVAPAGSWSQGSFTVNGTASTFSRLAAPDGMFDALAVGLKVADSDGPVLSALDMNPTVAAGSSFTHKKIGTTTKVRFGRLRASNVSGSGALQMPLTLQYWSGNTWVQNTDDACTVIPLAAIKLADVSGSLASGTTKACVISYCSSTDLIIVGGLAYLQLTPGSTTAGGTVSACVDLGSDPSGGTSCSATGTGMSYLQGRWPPGSNYDNDPAGLATFGIYAPETRRTVHIRELY